MDNLVYGMYGLQKTNPISAGISQGMQQNMLQQAPLGQQQGIPASMPQMIGGGMPQMPMQMDMYGQQQNGVRAALLSGLMGGVYRG